MRALALWAPQQLQQPCCTLLLAGKRTTNSTACKAMLQRLAATPCYTACDCGCDDTNRAAAARVHAQHSSTGTFIRPNNMTATHMQSSNNSRGKDNHPTPARPHTIAVLSFHMWHTHRGSRLVLHKTAWLLILPTPLHHMQINNTRGMPTMTIQAPEQPADTACLFTHEPPCHMCH